MKKLVVVACVGAAIVLLIRKVSSRGGIDWESRLEKMPDDFPPKWMCSNISSIRENTDVIREQMDALISRLEPVG